MLNLERLRTLDALARHGSVSGAAEGLHVTTSAVSQQMAKLEREVGQQLLAKNGRGVRLTDAGRLLADHAARILSQVELAQSDLEAQRGQVVGELRLSAFPTAARGLFPPRSPPCAPTIPNCGCARGSWSPRPGSPAVVRGDLDLAVVLDWYNKPMPRARRAGQGRDSSTTRPTWRMPAGPPARRTAPRWTWRSSPTTSGSPGPRASSATSG